MKKGIIQNPSKELKSGLRIAYLAIIIFSFFIVLNAVCNPANAQTKKDSIPTPIDTLSAQYRYSMTQNVMSYFEQNFATLSIQQFKDFQKYLDDLISKYLASFIIDLDKKRAIKK